MHDPARPTRESVRLRRRRLTKTAGVFAMAVLGAGGGVNAQPASSRGELLYRTHCIACHTTQMHWRDARRATDWESLIAQVSAWQSRTGQAWIAEDVEEVAAWLNTTIYRFVRPERRG